MEQVDWASSTELDELRRWVGLRNPLPTDATLVRLLTDVLELRLHPFVVKELLSKASLVQLVTQRNLLGPRELVAPLILHKLAELQEGPTKNATLTEEELSCSQVDGNTFTEPQKIDTFFNEHTGWFFMPIALCGSATVLAGVTLAYWA